MPKSPLTPRNPRPPRSSGPAKVGAAPIGINTADDPNRGRNLPLPHERDQSIGNTDPTPSPVIEQAKRDIDAGLVDTDMRATPGLDAELRRKLVPPPR